MTPASPRPSTLRDDSSATASATSEASDVSRTARIPRLPAWLRALGRWAAIGAALALAPLLVLPWIDAVAGNIVPVLQALTLPWLLLTCLLLFAALAARSRAVVLALVPALIAAVPAGWLILHRPSVPHTPAAAGKHLRVLSLNAEFGEADAARTVALFEKRRPDVVVFVEMTRDKLRQLDARGLNRAYPHRSAGMIDDGSRGSIVLAKYPLTTKEKDTHLSPWELQSPVVTVAAPGAEITVHAVHTYPPIRDGAAEWRPQLERVGQWQRANAADHLILAGDFNAGTVHPVFRYLARGLVDVVPALHGSASPTWPHESIVPPFVQIDHVLTRGFTPASAGIETVPGTDHAAVWADLTY